jgi:aryl-alcohol dehydrogenase-like predicted oxidoreductase
MTWGTHTSQDDAHEQIEMSLEAGINFIDTAEMYPVLPIAAETIGRSERVLGNWIANSTKRSDVVVATKVSGAGMRHVRDGAPISRQTITEAVEASLRRLKTDYIDLYQFHWPNRGSYMFRQNWSFDPSKQSSRDEIIANMVECLETLDDLVKAGKIRAFGLSNESAWGTAQWLRLSEEMGLPRVVSMQNEYSLLCRLYDTDMAELAVHEDVLLMAFSPLATGYLTGKYANGVIPDGSRRSISGDASGRETPRVHQAVAAYQAIADKYGLDLIQMALAWCQTRPFPTSAVFGATRNEQLPVILESAGLTLSDEVLADITAAHQSVPMPY